MAISTSSAAIAGGVVVILALSACGRDASESDSAVSAASESAIDDSPASGTIDVWAMGTEGELFPELAEQFEVENPDATVRVTAVPWSDYASKIQTAIASGSTPDATMLGASDIASFAVTDGLEPVPEGLIDTANIYPGAVDAATFDDELYAVPWYVETRSLYYRKDLAEAAGLEPPKTWEEFYTFAQALQSDAGVEWGYSSYTSAPNTFNYVLPFSWQAGASILSEDGSAYQFDTPEALEGLEYWQSLYETGIANPNGHALGEVEPQFIAGQVGTFISGPWTIGLLEEAGGPEFLDESVGLITLPEGPVSNAGVIGGGSWSVFEDAENRDGAWKFVRWLGEQSTQESWFEISAGLPARQDAWETGELASDPYLAVFRDQLTTAQPMPPTTTFVEIKSALDTEYERVAKGEATAKESLESLQEQADAIGTGQ